MSRSTLEPRLAGILSEGVRIERLHEYKATLTLVEPKSVNHALHAVLSVFTLGAWLIIWIVVAIAASANKQQVVSVSFSVDEEGQLIFQSMSSQQAARPAQRDKDSEAAVAAHELDMAPGDDV